MTTTFNIFIAVSEIQSYIKYEYFNDIHYYVA